MVDRGRMLRESVRRDLSDRSAGGWEPDVPPGTASDAESGGGMPVPDYESEDGRMRPWAGLDDDDDDNDAAADVHSDFDDARSAGDDVDDPAAVAAAAAGRRLAPAPTSARAIAAANAAGVVRATAPGQSWAPPARRTGLSAAEAQAAAEAAADAAVPRADRLRLHPEYVSATADDYAHLVRSHDWRRTLIAVKEEARRRGRLEVSVLDVGCGAGAFTAALAASGALLPRDQPALLHDDDDDEAVPLVPCSFRVDLLDPSPRALRAAAASLVPPLALGELRCASVQDFARAALTSTNDVNTDAGSVGVSRGTYDVVWAVHTPSHVPCGVSAGAASSLASFLKSLRDLLRPGGFGFIAAPTNDSHYARFHALYRREFGPGSGFDVARIGDPSRPKPGFNGGDPGGRREHEFRR